MLELYAQTLEIFDTPVRARHNQFRPAFPKKMLGERPAIAHAPRVPLVSVGGQAKKLGIPVCKLGGHGRTISLEPADIERRNTAFP